MDLLADDSTFLWLYPIEKIEYLQRLIMHLPYLNHKAEDLSELHRSCMLQNDAEFPEHEQYIVMDIVRDVQQELDELDEEEVMRIIRDVEEEEEEEEEQQQQQQQEEEEGNNDDDIGGSGLSAEKISKHLKVSVRHGMCSICMREYEENEGIGRLDYCRHEFHADCVKDWLLRKNECPLCRATGLKI